MGGTKCFTCGQESASFHLFSDSIGEKSTINIWHIICQHFWFEELDLQTSKICEPCWEKVYQFHRFYQEVKQYHEQLSKTDLPSVFIKQEEIEIEETQLSESKIEVKDENPFDGDLSVAEECNQLPMDTGVHMEDLSKTWANRRRSQKQQAEDEFIKQHRSFDCEDCTIQFDNFTTLIHHAADFHGKSYIECCNLRFVCRTRLHQHVQHVLNPEMFKCEICDKSFKSRLNYTRHKRKVHASEDRFQCDECPKSFMEEYRLKSHKAAHENLRICKTCGKYFRTKVGLKVHVEKEHSKIATPIDGESVQEIAEESNQLPKGADKVVKNSSKPKHVQPTDADKKVQDDYIQQHIPYVCEDCSERFDNFSVMRRHRADAHNKPYIMCCNMRYEWRNKLHKHVQSVLNPESLKCKICDKAFDDKRWLNRHHQEEHGSLEFKCDRCPKSYTNERELTLHKATHETLENEKAKCETCGKCYKSQRYLKEHRKRFHEAEVNFICELCAKPFYKRTDYLDHQQTHNLTADELKKQCPICHKWMKNVRYWRKHLKRHRSEGKHKCDQCDHVSINSMSLQLHIERKHTKSKKYVCDICGKEYSRPVTLKEHIANAHTGKPLYECPFCGKKFFSNASMYAHKKKGHPEEWQKEHNDKYANRENDEGSGESLN